MEFSYFKKCCTLYESSTQHHVEVTLRAETSAQSNFTEFYLLIEDLKTIKFY